MRFSSAPDACNAEGLRCAGRHRALHGQGGKPCTFAHRCSPRRSWPPPPWRGAQNLPNGFHRTDPIVGRDLPTGVYFAHDGRVFVTEKNGQVWLYHNLEDHVPVLFADISSEVHTVGDRGLLGFALDPRFPEVPRVYMLYAFNGGLFSDPPPRWGSDCGTTVNPTPPPDSPGGCVIGAHLSRFDVNGDTADTANETVLIEDWYQFFQSHSIGTLLFGADGYLYVGGGEGASYNWADWGQGVGNPTYPDQRSPMVSGVPEGGALRSLGLEVESSYTNQEVWLDGAILRVNPVDRRRRAGQSARLERTLGKRQTHHRLWPSQSLPLHRAARHG